MRWLKVVLAWQVIVLVSAGGYIFALGSQHHSSVAWTAPAIGAIIGTALPLQFVVVGIFRSARR